LRQHPSAGTPQQNQAVEQQLEKYQRMLQLIPFDSLLPTAHDIRVLQAADIAHQRYENCLGTLQWKNNPNANNPDLLALGTQWTQLGSPNVHALEGNAALQDRIIAWTSQAEIVTAKVCGPPTGDDALLLELAQTPDKTE
jgi:hypothetical protein